MFKKSLLLSTVAASIYIPTNSTLAHISEKKKHTLIWKYTSTPKFTAALFIVAKTQKHLSVHQQMSGERRRGTYAQEVPKQETSGGGTHLQRSKGKIYIRLLFGKHTNEKSGMKYFTC